MSHASSTALREHEVGILERVITLHEKRMPQAAARYLLELKLLPAAVDRITELSARAREGNLSEREAELLDSFLRVGAFLSIVQSKARRMVASDKEAQ